MNHASQVRVVSTHVELPDSDYHEWVTVGERVKADRQGRIKPRLIDAAWTKWVCNNPDCSAFALVPDDAIRRLIEAASHPGGYRSAPRPRPARMGHKPT